MAKDFDAVVFDMDGVLFDSERAIMECWCETAERHGLENFDVHYPACIGTNGIKMKSILCGIYGDFPFEDYFRETYDLYHAKFGGGKLRIMKGVFELLDFLKSEGKPMAVATSTNRRTATNELRDGGLLDYFSAVICGDMLEKSKPDPDIYLKACALLNTDPARTYAVEDSYNGIRSAAAGKLHPIMVPDMLPPTDEMGKLSEIILPDLLAVKEYLK